MWLAVVVAGLATGLATVESSCDKKRANRTDLDPWEPFKANLSTVFTLERATLLNNSAFTYLDTLLTLTVALDDQLDSSCQGDGSFCIILNKMDEKDKDRRILYRNGKKTCEADFHLEEDGQRDKFIPTSDLTEFIRDCSDHTHCIYHKCLNVSNEPLVDFINGTKKGAAELIVLLENRVITADPGKLQFCCSSEGTKPCVPEEHFSFFGGDTVEEDKFHLYLFGGVPALIALLSFILALVALLHQSLVTSALLLELPDRIEEQMKVLNRRDVSPDPIYAWARRFKIRQTDDAAKLEGIIRESIQKCNEELNRYPDYCKEDTHPLNFYDWINTVRRTKDKRKRLVNLTLWHSYTQLVDMGLGDLFTADTKDPTYTTVAPGGTKMMKTDEPNDKTLTPGNLKTESRPVPEVKKDKVGGLGEASRGIPTNLKPSAYIVNFGAVPAAAEAPPEPPKPVKPPPPPPPPKEPEMSPPPKPKKPRRAKPPPAPLGPVTPYDFGGGSKKTSDLEKDAGPSTPPGDNLPPDAPPPPSHLGAPPDPNDFLKAAVSVAQEAPNIDAAPIDEDGSAKKAGEPAVPSKHSTAGKSENEKKGGPSEKEKNKSDNKPLE